MEKKTAIVLLSGGLDSTVAAFLLRPEIEPVLALTVDYGQKAARRELAAGYAVSRALDIEHRTIFLSYLREASSGALTDRNQSIPDVAPEDLDDSAGARSNAAAVWVPNRNGSLIAMAATWAEVNDVPYVVCGFNREEAATFPDNSEAFLEAQNTALGYSTRNRVRVISPTIGMDKVEIVRAGVAAGAPLHRCWTCYRGDTVPCGRCESCRRFARALDGAGVKLEDLSPTPDPGAPPR